MWLFLSVAVFSFFSPVFDPVFDPVYEHVFKHGLTI